MAKLRPVSSEDRFTLVEHLTELRSRIITGLLIFAVAFAVSYWQNGTVLKIVNAPLENAQKPDAKKCLTGGDSLEQSTCFDKAVSTALQRIQPLVEEGGNRENATEAQRRADALKSIDRVRELTPRNANRKPVTLGVAEPFFQTLNIAMYGALVLSLPLLLYQLYAFLIPAFTSRERKAVVPLLIGVPFLFYAGVAFGYFLALPRAVDFLQNFNDQSFDILVQAKDYYKFVGLFLAGTGLVFQVPVIIIAISRLGIMSAKQLRKQRGIIWIIAAVVAAVITPTPDAVTMILMMAPLVVLFEISVTIAAFFEKRNPVGGVLAGWRDLDDPDDGDDDPDDGGFDLDPDPEPDPPSGGTAAAPSASPTATATRPGTERASTYEGEDHLQFESDGERRFGGVHADDDDETFDDDIEAPDPELQGDPDGPRLATDEDPPFMPPLPGPGTGETSAPAEEPAPQAEEAWMRDADALDAADPYAGPDEDDETPRRD